MGYNKNKSKEYKELLRSLLKTPSMARDDSYIRIHYVRYADDFVIGIEGSSRVAKEILTKVESFINDELHLKLNPEKTGIINYSENPLGFLGFNIIAPHFKGRVKPHETVEINGKNIRRKKVRISIEMDTQKVLKKLASNPNCQLK